MITATERTATAWQPAQDERTAVGPILVATDGTESSVSALRVAMAFSRRSDADVMVLAVLEGLPLVAADYGIIIPPIESLEERRQALAKRVATQLLNLGEATAAWTVEIREGDPAATIARSAHEFDARMIIIGLGHHELLDRLFGGEVALHVVRTAKTPVLAVPPASKDLPTRMVLATDFSMASVAAGRAALSLIDTIKTAYLLHVAPRLELQPEAFAAWMSVFGEGIGPAFERIKAEIGAPESVTVETITRTGKASREVLEFAKSVKADLIVTGSRGAGLVDRLLVGSTATGLLRGAECAVLAVPTGLGSQRVSWPSTGKRVSVEPNHWGQELDSFTRRNVGRIASLEVDDPEMGAQAQEHDYPFLGATWDHHDERVEIMVGDFEGTGRHLTRTVSGVTGIDVLRDEAGRDWILRIEHGRGQTILALKR